MISHPAPLAIFITATDTDVGKTTITAALILALQQHGQEVGVLKPIETGINFQRPEYSDTARFRSLFSPPPPFSSICLYAFPQPLAPLACARKAGKTIEVPRIVSVFHDTIQQYALVFVEGAGGLLTPITPTHTVRDLIVALDIPVLVIGRTGLGSVNHLLLTLESLWSAGLKLSGIVLNDPFDSTRSTNASQQRDSTIELIREFSPVSVFGPLEFQKTLGVHWRKGVEILAEHPEIQRLAGHLMKKTP
jgi:dethiobiotin synthetase